MSCDDGFTYANWPAASHAADAEDARVSNASGTRSNFILVVEKGKLRREMGGCHEL